MENTGFKFESRIFYFIDLQNEEDYVHIPEHTRSLSGGLLGHKIMP